MPEMGFIRNGVSPVSISTVLSSASIYTAASAAEKAAGCKGMDGDGPDREDNRKAAQAPAIGKPGAGLTVPKAKPTNGVAKPAAPKVEFDFNQKMIDLGTSALPLLRDRNYEAFDPLIGDWSCQLRTLWLIHLIKSHPHCEGLTDGDLKGLGLYRLLTLSALDEQDPLRMSLSQSTNLKFVPPGWESVSKGKLNECYGTAKKQLSALAVETVGEALAKSGSPYREELMQRFSDQTYTTYSGIPIRFVEFFAGYLAIVQLALESQTPIVVALKQFSHEDGRYGVNGIDTLFYRPSGGKFVVGDAADDMDEPAIVIDMYTALSSQSLSAPQNGLSFAGERNFDKASQGFQGLDIVDIILDIAATHPQFPQQGYVAGDKERLSLQTISRDDAVATLRQTCAERGQNEKVGTELYFSKDGGFFTESIPINTEHVYVSTFRRVADRAQTFFSEVAGRTLTADELAGK